MATQKKKYDVRVIRYIKARLKKGQDGESVSTPSKIDLENFCKGKECQYVICLSHFDYLIFDCLTENSEKSPLDVIDKDRKNQTSCDIGDKEYALKEDNYTYPLYILTEIGDDTAGQKISDFWKLKSDYTSVVRIHYSGGGEEATHLGTDFFMQQMNTAGIEISKQGPAIVTVDTPVGDNKEVPVEVSCLVYDSLELGDSVVILKSSSMVATLNISRILNEMPCVLDCYTYIGIKPDLFTNPEEHKKCQRDIIKLNSASTRFTVKRLKHAGDYFDKYFMGEEIGFITGTTDARIRWKGDSSRNLSEQIFLGKISKLDPDKPEFHRAFRDVITRTGIEWKNKSKEQNTQQTELSSDYMMLFDKDKTPAIGWFSGNGEMPQWLKNDDLLYLSLKKLLGAVQAMGQDGVMDALADLLVPSMRALFSRLYELRDTGWKPEYKGIIEGLLHDYYSLIQNISQLESQLVQHPEIYPVPYYIPAAVLQFELQFTKYCSELFRDMDDDTRKKYVFLPVLIPKYQSDASTIAPLDPSHGSSLIEVDGRISPLRIYLPIKLLYRPHEAAHQLCHELAHYCGDVPRNRDIRFEAFCICCAAMLMTSWEEMVGDEACYIDWDDSTIKEELNFLEERIKSGYKKNAEFYLTDVREHLLEKLREIGLNPRYYEYFHNILFVRTYTSQASIIRAKIMAQQSRMNSMVYTHFWEHHIDYLKDLFRECYADLAMLKLLDCSAETYCKCFYESFESVHKKFSNKAKEITLEILSDPSLKRQVDRMAFVLHIMGDEFMSAAREISNKPIPVQRAIEQAELLKELSKVTRNKSSAAEQRISCRIHAILKTRNTSRIPSFSELSPESKSFAVSSFQFDQSFPNVVMQNQDAEAVSGRPGWNGENKNDSSMTKMECRAIVQYLQKCRQALDRKLAELDKRDSKKLKTLRTALKATSQDGFDWAAVQEFVWKIQHTS